MPSTRSNSGLALALILTACGGETGPATDAGMLGGDGSFAGHDAGPVGGSCETGCTGFSYCDVFSNTCRPGCGDDSACGANQFCQLTGRTCECAASAHACGEACVESASVATCGTRCEPCPTVADADPTCLGGACGFRCRAGFQQCGSACVSCPTAGVGATSCAGSTCIATACTEGYGPCSTGCCRWESANIPLLFGDTYDLHVVPSGSELHGVVNNGSQLIYIHGVGGSWTSIGPTATPYVRLDAPYAISAQGPTLVAISGQELTSLRGSGTSWTATVAPETGTDEIHIARCGSHPVGGTVCFAADQYGPTLYRLAASGAWSDRQDVSSYPLRDADVAVDASGSAHVVTVTRTLAYWHDDGLTPEYEHDVTDAGAVRIVLDASGEPHIFTNGETVEHTYRVAGAWRRETICPTGENASSTLGAVIDASGNIHVAFGTWTDLRYAVYDGTRWRTSILDTSGQPVAVDVAVVGTQPQVFASVYSPGHPDEDLQTYWLP